MLHVESGRSLEYSAGEQGSIAYGAAFLILKTAGPLTKNKDTLEFSFKGKVWVTGCNHIYGGLYINV